MQKIQMSDVSSGSENVKALFRMTMSVRLKSTKLNTPLTNDELSEVLLLANTEYHDNKRWFLEKLIEKQPGPFDKKIFDSYLPVLFDRVAKLELLKKSEASIYSNDKLKWLQYIGVTDAHWLIYDFLIPGEAKTYGIDIFSPPFNTKVAYLFMQHILGKLNFYDRKERLPTLFKFFDSMSENDIYSLYINDMSVFPTDLLSMIIMDYQAMPTRVVRHFFHANISSVQIKIATHPNCPTDIRHEMFLRTNNIVYLPKESVGIFIF